MDLRFVSSLISVIDEGSLAAAARLGRITPSAVAQRIAALEAQLQVQLLSRAGRVMQPTPECRSILPRLRQLLRDEAALIGDLQAEALQGPLRLGAISTQIGDHAADLVSRLRKVAPQVELQLIPGASSALFAAFEEETLDAALIVKPGFGLAKTMQFTTLARQEIGWLIPGCDPKFDAEDEREDVSFNDLPYILYSREAWGGLQCWEALQAHTVNPRILAEMDALESIAQMVADGLGRSVLPRWASMQRYAAGAQFTPIEGLYRELGLLNWRRDSTSPVMKLLQNLLAGKVEN